MTDRRDERARMVDTQIRARGVVDARVLAAMARVPRHLFVPAAGQADAYGDHPLPIGGGQTISQPYIVAYMTELLALEPGHRVLEIGTGSAYQTAVLAEIAGEVWTIEVVPALAAAARVRLSGMGYANVRLREGSGWEGWPDAAPFDRVLVTAAPAVLPPALADQLTPGGILVAPVGDGDQRLVRIVRTADGFDEESLIPVRFVPMVR
jgi:protein-L-isoaspartate(D-aspartate) O-methyltransferase